MTKTEFNKLWQSALRAQDKRLTKRFGANASHFAIRARTALLFAAAIALGEKGVDPRDVWIEIFQQISDLNNLGEANMHCLMGKRKRKA